MDKLGCASSPPREGESMGTITEVAAAATAAAEEELLVVVAAAAAAAARGEGEGEQQKKKKNFVSWCFEPSQPQRIIAGLKTSFGLSPSYSFHRALYHKSLFLKPQLKSYAQFLNANPTKQ